jgi:arylsulfatase A-like enzyme
MPNVILIMLDSLRRDHVGAYGNDWIRTPNIDALAGESVRFLNAYPEALPTLPVRRAMHTGMRTFPCRGYKLHKGDTVLIPGWQPIPEGQVTMAEVFRHHGYKTALFASTLHMFKPSMNYHRGFSTWEWIRGQEADRYRIPLTGEIEDPAKLPCDLAYGCVGHSLSLCLANMQGWETEADWFPPRIFGSAISWLERNAGEEFLLVIDEFDPHEPWNAPRDILELYFDTESYGGRRVINTTGGPYEFREGELEYTLAQYAGEVTLCDKYVGALLDRVKELGLWDDTVVALVSDHGHNIMDHGVIHKLPDHMYRELMDLVYMIRSPDGEAAGSGSDAYVAHHDIPVTLMTMAGVEPPSGLDGENAWAWATGESPQTRDHATCMFYPWLWYRDGDHAYMTDIDGDQEKLYDVKKDPKQMVDIAEENGDVCRSIKNLLWDEMGGDPPRYEIMREGHEWYEYPDVYDPTSTISKRIRERRLKG